MKVKVLNVSATQIITGFAGTDLYRLEAPVKVEVTLKGEGVLRYSMLPGFLTDMRSGAHIIDPAIPKFTGNNLYNAAILCHDFAYTMNADGLHELSKETADDLLREMVIYSGQLGVIRAYLMYKAVDWFGSKAYNAQSDQDYGGRGGKQYQYMSFRWDAK